MANKILNTPKISHFNLCLLRAFVKIHHNDQKTASQNLKLLEYKENLQREEKTARNRIVLTLNFSKRNIIATVARSNGKVVKNITGGMYTKRKSEKKMKNIGPTIIKDVNETIRKLGIEAYKEVHLRVAGFNSSRNNVIQSFIQSRPGENLCSFEDFTPIPFNGPKPKKANRIKKRK